jgi:hypothetical protein
MLWVRGILHCIQELVVTVNATHIFRRALAHSPYTTGKLPAIACGQNLFQFYLVPPTVAKIILILDGLTFPLQNTADKQAGFIPKAHHVILILRRVANQPTIRCLK